VKGKTVSELAWLLKLSEPTILELLRQDVDRGVVVERDGHFALSPDAEQKFGAALRTMGPREVADCSEPARQAQVARAA
jgi:hypothetical protein